MKTPEWLGVGTSVTTILAALFGAFFFLRIKGRGYLERRRRRRAETREVEEDHRRLFGKKDD